MDKLAVIEKKMAGLARVIQETKERLPAHSTKPPVMMELLDLEDEYDRLMKERDRLKTLKGKG